MPTPAVENYLKQIFMLAREAQGQLVPMGAIAQAMQVVPGTATTMVKHLAESGHLDYTPRLGVLLTPKGEAIAIQILRRHRIIEYFLVETLGMDWSEIHEEAEQLEHAISDRVLGYIDAFLGFPTEDPHGDSIPSAEGEFRQRKLETLSDAYATGPFRIAKVKDQDSQFLKYAEQSSLTPGTEMVLVARDDHAACFTLQFRETGRTLVLGIPATDKILIERL